MGEPVLKVERSEGIATLTLNRPQAMNALSGELRRALVTAFREVAGERDTAVLILTGAGRAFSAGIDLKELGGEAGDASARDAEVAIAGGDLVGAMLAVPQPIIGAINGFAITGGFEVALACDVLIASTEARFADTHARVGIMPGWGLSQRLPRAIGIYRAKELSLTGNYLDAQRAYEWGLVNRVVAPDELIPACRAIARDMMSCEPDVVRSYKRIIDQGFATTFGEGLRLEDEASRAHMRGVTRDAIAARRAGIQQRGRSQSRA
ncbi:MAG TPA: enoyl-CoA hydratase [Candidatus Binatia bacterium]|nr:enoyl-CoA hydratase [Candidatus Binatia bacterium]